MGGDGTEGGRVKNLCAFSLACRTMAMTCLACVGCGTAVGTGVGGAGTFGGRAKILVADVVSMACRAAAAACLACVACRTATGTSATRAGATGGRRWEEGTGCGHSLHSLDGLMSRYCGLIGGRERSLSGVRHGLFGRSSLQDRCGSERRRVESKGRQKDPICSAQKRRFHQDEGGCCCSKGRR